MTTEYNTPHERGPELGSREESQVPKYDWDARYICVGPLAWGRGDSIQKAKRMCVSNISGTVKGPKVQHCVVYEVFSDDVQISGMDGSLNWPEGDTPPRIVWMGSEFSRLNPGRSVGEPDHYEVVTHCRHGVDEREVCDDCNA